MRRFQQLRALNQRRSIRGVESKALPTGPTPITILRILPVNALSYTL